MERLVEVTLEIDAELKEQAEKVFAEWNDFGRSNDSIF